MLPSAPLLCQSVECLQSLQVYWGLLGASFLVVVVFLAIAGVEKVVYQFLFGRKASLRIECEAVGIIAWGCIDKLNKYLRGAATHR